MFGLAEVGIWILFGRHFDLAFKDFPRFVIDDTEMILADAIYAVNITYKMNRNVFVFELNRLSSSNLASSWMI